MIVKGLFSSMYYKLIDECTDCFLNSDDESERDREDNKARKYRDLYDKLRTNDSFSKSIVRQAESHLLDKNFISQLDSATYCIPVGDGMILEFNRTNGILTSRNRNPYDKFSMEIKSSYSQDCATHLIRSNS